MDNIAVNLVKDYIIFNLDKEDKVPNFKLFIVWKCKVLQNWKYLISSTIPNGMYYELTYNGDKKEWYLDTYKKFDNKCIKMLKYVDTLVGFAEIPDEITLCINISNCPCHCINCHSSYLAEDIGEPLDLQHLTNLIDSNKGITCVCIMGGDANPSEVDDIAQDIKEYYPNLKVGWYSGRDYISKDINLENFNYIKYGHYDENKGPLNSKTTNQVMLEIDIVGNKVFKKDITSKFWGEYVNTPSFCIFKLKTMKIKVKETVKGLYTEAKNEKGNVVPFINPIGDCIDLRAAEDYEFEAPQAGILHQKDGVKTRDVKFDEKLIKLGIAMQLPKGFSAKIRQRSSTTKKLKLVMATSGFIDTAYCGDNDEWGFYCYSIDKTTIHKGDRICQFEIVPNQFATIWQKLKWLFSSKIEFEWVDKLDNVDRGGHGKTGVKVMILEAILVLTGVSAIGNIVNLFMKNKEVPKESISIKKYMPGDLPVITLYNNDTPFNFLLDTGSNICHICPSVVKNIKYSRIDKSNTETVGLGGKSVQSNNCKAIFTDEKNKEYNINLVISKEFEMSANSIEKCIGVKINGLLGTNFLQEYKYTIDFKTLEVYVKK